MTNITHSLDREYQKLDGLRNQATAWTLPTALITAIALVAITICLIYSVKTGSSLYIKAAIPAFAALILSIPFWIKSMKTQGKLTTQRTSLKEGIKKALIEKHKEIELAIPPTEDTHLKSKREKKIEKQLVTFIKDTILKDAGHRTTKSLLLAELITLCPKTEFPMIHAALTTTKTALAKELEGPAEE